MKIFIVRGVSGYESQWIAKAFTLETDARKYIHQATEEAKALIESHTTYVPEVQDDGETINVAVVEYTSATNWATMLDPNFRFDGCNPGDFYYTVIETDLIG